MAKYDKGMYKTSYFRGGSNMNINIIKCEDKISIPLIIQRYISHWYHTYLLHPVMDRMEEMIFHHLYWTGIIKPIRMEVNSCDTCQCKNSQIKNMVNYHLRKMSKYHGINSM